MNLILHGLLLGAKKAAAVGTESARIHESNHLPPRPLPINEMLLHEEQELFTKYPNFYTFTFWQ